MRLPEGQPHSKEPGTLRQVTPNPQVAGLLHSSMSAKKKWRMIRSRGGPFLASTLEFKGRNCEGQKGRCLCCGDVPFSCQSRSESGSYSNL